MNPTFFSNQEEFRNWLEKNHDSRKELWVGYYKVDSGIPSITWPQSVDEAICFGWIDGIRKSIDKKSYCIRFTPRNPKSDWSVVNINKAERLIKEGLMHPSGLKLFQECKESDPVMSSNRDAKLTPEMEKTLKQNMIAWTFFNSQAPSYQRTMCYWIMSAKQEPTKFRRLEKLIKASETGKRVMG
ncbi:MAG: YdeI/OmpD-associated family protein [Bacteroidales bacterium]|nr:YdeI/OmpD-associated family protein [Bacteroidales bacterium]